MPDTRAAGILQSLGIGRHNPAACVRGRWLAGKRFFASMNPATAEPLAFAAACSPQDYEHVMRTAHSAWDAWRALPAPHRGEVMRLIAAELRRRKDVLGSLVSLETGKIKAEGDGEVQEMIDIADFAAGLSRTL